MSDKNEKISRHCAHCLQFLLAEKVKLCGGCLRRAYCGQECQKYDWSKPWSQGHKNWCKLGCGEEDLDWVVAPIPGKGLGVIAKRLIPAKFRIMVDASRQTTHPGVADLLPIGGSVQEKILTNGLADAGGKSVICLRISRANHSCSPNADHFSDETFNVKILYAKRDIQEGEEICISYTQFDDISKSISAAQSRSLLKMNWGITCPDDCICRNEEIEKIVNECKKLDQNIFALGSVGNIRGALQAVNLLLQKTETMNEFSISRKRTLHDGFQIAIMKRKTLAEGKKYIQEAHDILSCIILPKSAECLKYAEWIENPARHPNYLCED